MHHFFWFNGHINQIDPFPKAAIKLKGVLLLRHLWQIKMIYYKWLKPASSTSTTLTCRENGGFLLPHLHSRKGEPCMNVALFIKFMLVAETADWSISFFLEAFILPIYSVPRDVHIVYHLDLLASTPVLQDTPLLSDMENTWAATRHRKIVGAARGPWAKICAPSGLDKNHIQCYV